MALWPALINLWSLLRGIKRDHFQIPIDGCVHYCGFRYGHNEYNPLETYLCDVYNRVPITQARRKFIHFLLHYRPRHIGEALGLENLSRNYPMWIYPWDVKDPRNTSRAWCHSPISCPDIITHFCESGILSLRIDEEFLLAERVLHSISENGYNPESRHVLKPQSMSYTPVQTFELRRSDGRSAYLLLDGNHRVSALSALGRKFVMVEQASTNIAFEKECNDWYGVRKGFYTREDALRIFNAYFKGNTNYQSTSFPATIIGPEHWTSMYKLKNIKGDV